MTDILIIQSPEAITLAQWTEAIESSENIRICREKFHVVEAPNGLQARFPINEGDAEIWVTELQKWMPVFHWHEEEGCASFVPPAPDDLEEKIWAAAAFLSKALNASVIGEDGEVYDLETRQASFSI